MEFHLFEFYSSQGHLLSQYFKFAGLRTKGIPGIHYASMKHNVPLAGSLRSRPGIGHLASPLQLGARASPFLAESAQETCAPPQVIPTAPKRRKGIQNLQQQASISVHYKHEASVKLRLRGMQDDR